MLKSQWRISTLHSHFSDLFLGSKTMILDLLLDQGPCSGIVINFALAEKWTRVKRSLGLCKTNLAALVRPRTVLTSNKRLVASGWLQLFPYFFLSYNNVHESAECKRPTTRNENLNKSPFLNTLATPARMAKVRAPSSSSLFKKMSLAQSQTSP